MYLILEKIDHMNYKLEYTFNEKTENVLYCKKINCFITDLCYLYNTFRTHFLYKDKNIFIGDPSLMLNILNNFNRENNIEIIKPWEVCYDTYYNSPIYKYFIIK